MWEKDQENLWEACASVLQGNLMTDYMAVIHCHLLIEQYLWVILDWVKPDICRVTTMTSHILEKTNPQSLCSDCIQSKENCWEDHRKDKSHENAGDYDKVGKLEALSGKLCRMWLSVARWEKEAKWLSQLRSQRRPRDGTSQHLLLSTHNQYPNPIFSFLCRVSVNSGTARSTITTYCSNQPKCC